MNLGWSFALALHFHHVVDLLERQVSCHGFRDNLEEQKESQAGQEGAHRLEHGSSAWRT